MRTANRDLGAMASFNGAQRALCVREYYRNNDSATEARRKFCSHYNIRNVNQAPTIQTIQNWVRKFESTGSTLTQPGRGRPRTSRDPENIERVRESGPFFYEDQRSRPVTVNTERYVAMLQIFFAPALQDFSGFNHRTWFQQDGATCHTSNDSIAAVREIFGQKLISKRGDINWPPRSPDLSPMDYFLWGYLKSKVYISNPGSIEELKENIRKEMQDIAPTIFRAVIENFRSRLQECKSKQGSHLHNVIFKK